MTGCLSRLEIMEEGFLLAQLAAGMDETKKGCQAPGIGIMMPGGQFCDALQSDCRQEQKREPCAAPDVAGLGSKQKEADTGNRQDNVRCDTPRPGHFMLPRSEENDDRREERQKKKDVIEFDQGAKGPSRCSQIARKRPSANLNQGRSRPEDVVPPPITPISLRVLVGARFRRAGLRCPCFS